MFSLKSAGDGIRPLNFKINNSSMANRCKAKADTEKIRQHRAFSVSSGIGMHTAARSEGRGRTPHPCHGAPSRRPAPIYPRRHLHKGGVYPAKIGQYEAAARRPDFTPHSRARSAILYSLARYGVHEWEAVFKGVSPTPRVAALEIITPVTEKTIYFTPSYSAGCWTNPKALRMRAPARDPSIFRAGNKPAKNARARARSSGIGFINRRRDRYTACNRCRRDGGALPE